jgi:hypothetical protein
MDPVSPQQKDCEAELRALVARLAPESLLIEREVDGTLIDWMLALTPAERLRAWGQLIRFAEAGRGQPTP